MSPTHVGMDRPDREVPNDLNDQKVRIFGQDKRPDPTLTVTPKPLEHTPKWPLLANPPHQPHPPRYRHPVDLTLTDAWTLWWTGQQLTDHTLYGAPVLWLGRAGKLLAFLAGTTIVLDIIGSERLVSWGNRVGRSPFIFLSVMVLLVIGALLITESVRPGEWLLENYPPWVLVLVMVVSAPMAWWGTKRLPDATAMLVVGFGRMLTNPRSEWWVRVIAVPLFFVGFALDYLAS